MSWRTLAGAVVSRLAGATPSLELWVLRAIFIALVLGGTWWHGYRTADRKGDAELVAAERDQLAKDRDRLTIELKGAAEANGRLVSAVRLAGVEQGKAEAQAARDEALARRWRGAYEDAKQKEGCRAWAVTPVPCRLSNGARGNGGGGSGDSDPATERVPVPDGPGLGP